MANVWYDKRHQRFLNLDMVCYWSFFSKQDCIDYNERGRKKMKEEPGCFVLYWTEEDRIELYFGGSQMFDFKGEEAREIYNKLTTPRQVL
jgi:hypothetical protein